MAEINQSRQRKPQKGGTKLLYLVIELIIVLVLVYSIGKWILNTVSVVNISAATPMTLTTGGSVFTLNNTEYSITLVPNTSTINAQVEILKDPAFLNPAQIVTLTLGNNTRVNTTGAFANLQIDLKTISAGSIQIVLTPLAASLALAPDSSKIAYVDTALKFLTVGGVGSNGGGSTSVTTTVSQGTTTIASTTTISQAQTNANIAANVVKNSIYYPLMLNYTTVYINTRNCTTVLYNNTYLSHYGHSASGANTYWNITQFVPYQMALSFTNTTPTNWDAIFSTTATSSFSTGPAIIIAINTTTQQILGTDTEGIFYHFNYTNVKSSYDAAANYHNACGVDVASSTP